MTNANPLARVEQMDGGKGINVSNERSAHAFAVAGAGQTAGTFSVTVIAAVANALLRKRNPNYLLALEEFEKDVPEAVEIIRTRVERKQGVPMYTAKINPFVFWLTVFGAYAMTWLAGRDHPYPVGANMLTKVAYSHVPCLMGIMMAMRKRPPGSVTYAAAGAGIPLPIVEAAANVATDHAATYQCEARIRHLDSQGRLIDEEDGFWPVTFDLDELSRDFSQSTRDRLRRMELERPYMIGIVSSASLALSMQKRSQGGFDGMSVEEGIAGGHVHLLKPGKTPMLERFQRLEPQVPFWLAGGYASPEKLAEAKSKGAAGVQYGSITAFAEESGFEPQLRLQLLQALRKGELEVVLDMLASPTGFPFHVAQRPQKWIRSCDIGHLRTPVIIRQEGSPDRIWFRCSAEPVKQFLRKGGDITDTEGRECLCRELLGATGLENPVTHQVDPPIVTLGREAVVQVPRFLDWLDARPGKAYKAESVIEYISTAS